MSNQDKTKFSIRIDTSLIAQIDEAMELANARTRTEFMENAIRFYIGHLVSGQVEDYLIASMSSILVSAIRDTENRLARMDFKTACSINKLAHIIAYTSEAIDDETMRRLNIRSMEEVKHLNGAIRYEDAVKAQRGEAAGGD